MLRTVSAVILPPEMEVSWKYHGVKHPSPCHNSYTACLPLHQYLIVLAENAHVIAACNKMWSSLVQNTDKVRQFARRHKTVGA